MNRRVRWGVLGVATIATRRVIPAWQRLDNAEVVAIASRDPQRATEAAAALGLPRAHGSYADLVADPAVDAVYIPLPNHLHVEWAIRAAEAGKHVLCEKPVALTAAEVDRLIAVRDGTGLAIQEAFMYRFAPQWQRAMTLIAEGRLGEVRGVTGVFSYDNADPSNIRNRVEYGGGGVYDIGCYLVNSARWVFGGEPRDVSAAIMRDPATGVDVLASFVLDFGTGHAVGQCGTHHAPHQRITIYGSRARLEVAIPVNVPADAPAVLWLDDVRSPTGTGAEIITLPPSDQYGCMGQAFSAAVLEGRPAPYPLEDSRANAVVIERLFSAGARHN